MRRELPIGLGLAQGCCVLRQGRPRLGADHREQLARLDARADIDIALNDIDARPGKDAGPAKAVVVAGKTTL
jgi:hypothetical protein